MGAQAGAARRARTGTVRSIGPSAGAAGPLERGDAAALRHDTSSTSLDAPNEPDIVSASFSRSSTVGSRRHRRVT
jgi:hypothetical protein